MQEFEFSIETIKELMDKMAKTHLGLMELEVGSIRLKLEAKQHPLPTVVAAPTAGIAEAAPVTIPVAEEPEVVAEPAASESPTGNVVKSPIVGTFYASPAPDKESFVKVGQQVKKGDVLFIIESMKLMNEVQSEFDGVVSQIYVKSGDGVEYGQPIMIIG
ncbi:MAG: acetyl-CoA carboxylase biotin carboxyl carrier protein [Clostridiales bacterium]|nr:acetyl-CoA carboxylase biotin carboxyl carrier protein [Clostridiales bacterium]